MSFASGANLFDNRVFDSSANGGEFDSDGEIKGAVNGVTAYVGQQLGDAGAARDDYNKKVKLLGKEDSESRSKIKKEARNKTPKLVSDFIAKHRPSTGPKAGSGGSANKTNSSANKAAAILKNAGRGLIFVNLALNAVDVVTAENSSLALMRSAGGVVGGLAGGAVGSITGSSVAPGPGTVAIGVTGAAIGGAGGEMLGEAAHNFIFGRREDSTSK